MNPLLLVIVQQAVAILLKKLFELDWKKFEKVKTLVKEADSLALPGKTEVDGADKDTWVRGKLAQDPEFKNVKAHVLDWLIGLAVGMLKKKLLG